MVNNERSFSSFHARKRRRNIPKVYRQHGLMVDLKCFRWYKPPTGKYRTRAQKAGTRIAHSLGSSYDPQKVSKRRKELIFPHQIQRQRRESHER